MSFNVWQPQGQVVPNLGGGVAGNFGNPSVIYDTNPVVLVGNTHVFKMWCGLGNLSHNLYYFESLDGITNWTAYSGNPIGLNLGFPTMWKVGNTFYHYLVQNPTFTSPIPISVYTSTDGVTLTLAKASAIPAGTGTWDSKGVFQPYIVIVDGVWYANYNGYDGTRFWTGAATSTDGINWTTNPANPVETQKLGSLFPMEVNNVFYRWGAFFTSAAGFAPNNYRVGRWSAPSPTGPWTPLQYNNVEVATYYLGTETELGNGSAGYPPNGPTDLYFCVAKGNIYLYYTLTAPNGSEQSVNCAVASGVTPAQLVASYEGVQNVPPTGIPELNFATVGTDNFQRANANPIGGNWTQESSIGTFSANQLVSNTVQGTSLTNTNSISYWNAGVFNNDQWSRVTASAVANTSSSIWASLRMSNAGLQTFYRVGWVPTAGSLGGAGTVFIQKDVAGTFMSLLSVTGITLNVGDTITAVAVGTNIFAYINDNLLSIVSDSSLTAGPVGLETAPSSSLSSAAISAWAGGNIQAAPTPPPVQLAYSVPDCRNYGNFPNLPIDVNGTLTYTFPSVDSRKAGAPVDSRAAGAPVASGTYPQNSRTPGTFGPGE